MFFRLFFVLFVMLPLSGEARKCSKLFLDGFRYPMHTLRFSQNFIGKYWAHLKRIKLEEKYAKWKQDNPKGTPQDFIFHYTQKVKKIPAVRDVNGILRIVDRHHEFHAIQEFLGTGSDPMVHVDVIFNYQSINEKTGKPWLRSQMVGHMHDNHWVNFVDGRLPRVRDLDELDAGMYDISLLQDLPERSLVSMMLHQLMAHEMDIKAKGSDFQKNFQNRFIGKMRERGIEFFPKEQDPFGQENIDRVIQDVLKEASLLQYALDDIRQDINPERQALLRDFFESQLLFLTQPRIPGPWEPI